MILDSNITQKHWFAAAIMVSALTLGSPVAFATAGYPDWVKCQHDVDADGVGSGATVCKQPTSGMPISPSCGAMTQLWKGQPVFLTGTCPSDTSVPPEHDNCPYASNANQTDTDGDGVGDVCQGDRDSDSLPDASDNCPATPNVDQLDTDGDLQGNVCDTDDDNDGVPDASDRYPLDATEALDNDKDGIGNNADTDDDNDGVLDTNDNCSLNANADQVDEDHDGIGNACDNDSAGNMDTGFHSGAGSGYVVEMALQQDGKLLFAQDSGNYIKRLNSDGSLDSGFSTVANNYVRAIAVQPDGKLLLGGYFTAVNGVVSNRLVRLNSDGSSDTSFNIGSGMDQGVASIAVQADGKILVAGVFTALNGVSKNKIARLNSDGSLDSSFNTLVNNYVGVVFVQANGKIMVSGSFTTVNGVARNGLARLNADGTLDASFNGGTGAAAIAVQSDGKVLIAGGFSMVNGESSGHIARLNQDGSLDASFDTRFGTNASISAIAIQADGKVLIGGEFQTFKNVMPIGRIARLNSDGSFDSSFSSGKGANNSVLSMAVQADGKLVIGGAFTTFNGATANYVARIYTGDADQDGVENAADACWLDSTAYVGDDTDIDGICNNADLDDDGDSVLDINDAYPLNAAESFDTDHDGIGNNADLDDDGDDVLDINDAYPLDATESVDADNDGIGNNADPDDDNDGLLDEIDPLPLQVNFNLNAPYKGSAISDGAARQ